MPLRILRSWSNRIRQQISTLYDGRSNRSERANIAEGSFIMSIKLEGEAIKIQMVRRIYDGLTMREATSIIRKSRQKKYGFKDVAIVLDEVNDGKYDLTLEYIV